MSEAAPAPPVVVIGDATGDKKGVAVTIMPIVGGTATAPVLGDQTFTARLVFSDDGGAAAAGDSKKQTFLKEMRGSLMVLATLAASMTYSAGLSPPGKEWDHTDAAAGIVAGSPVLRDVNGDRYWTFYYFNATAFATSVVIILLLINENFYHHESKIVALEIAVILDLAGLMGAYVAGSTRYASSSIYVIIICALAFLYVLYTAAILPALCSCALFRLPCLEKAADKKWLPVPAGVLDKVKETKAAYVREGKRLPSGVCSCVCGSMPAAPTAAEEEVQPAGHV